METEATQPPSGLPAATAAYPRWVLLEHFGKNETVGSFSTADATTLATARTSNGHLTGVSLRLAPPPAVSSVCIHFPRGVKDTDGKVLASHGDSILISICFRECVYHDHTADYFVYNAGAATAEPPRPPSLSLLPPYYLTEQELKKSHTWREGPVQRCLDEKSTGLLRHGEDEFAVAELMIVPASDVTLAREEAKLFLLRSGHWSVKRPAVIVHGDGKVNELLLSSWRTYTVLPVGDKELCWVDLCRGLMFCNVLDESPVKHVSLPVGPVHLEPLSGPGSARNVCVTSGGGAVKFIGIFPRCCCGATGSTHCRHSLQAYTIDSWTLRMDDMVWVMDGIVDAAELWALDSYATLPRARPVCPIVSMDDPHIICLIVRELNYIRADGGETGLLLLVDTRRKALLSVARHSHGQWLSVYRDLIPSRVSGYLDANPSSSSAGSPLLEGNSDMISSSSPGVAVDELQINEAANSMCSSSKLSADLATDASVIFAAFHEIPSYGLERDDMLRAYSILSQDNGRKFRSLLALPKNTRKDWLLMEIKATKA